MRLEAKLVVDAHPPNRLVVRCYRAMPVVPRRARTRGSGDPRPPPSHRQMFSSIVLPFLLSSLASPIPLSPLWLHYARQRLVQQERGRKPGWNTRTPDTSPDPLPPRPL